MAPGMHRQLFLLPPKSECLRHLCLEQKVILMLYLEKTLVKMQTPEEKQHHQGQESALDTNI